MIPAPLLQKIEDIRQGFQEAMKLLDGCTTFQALIGNSELLRSEFAAIKQVADLRRLRQPCDGRVVCTLIGSSNHGKTTLMEEMFPELKNWLITDSKDATAQSLRLSFASNGEANHKIKIGSWGLNQVIRLVESPEAKEQNQRCNIRVACFEDHVDIDGSEASIQQEDLRKFRFPKRIELWPFSSPYSVSQPERTNEAFIRALTTKQEAQLISTEPLLQVDGRPYNILQLRTLVKDIEMDGNFEQIRKWAAPDDVSKLVFVDTPGLATSGNVKDEVLMHCLAQKSNQIVLQLLKDDELDVIIHLVLCGEASAFSVLARTLERELGRSALEDLAERMILVITGTHRYLVNPDLIRKGHSQLEGDIFSTTLEDNILNRMGLGNRVRPARTCFVDARKFVETYGKPYEQFFDQHLPTMKQWLQPGCAAHGTLSRLGLLDSFAKNLDSLCRSDDRGQGFLIRQIVELIKESGPFLFVKKYLHRTKLRAALKDLAKLLLRYYDTNGQSNRRAIRESIQRCFNFVDPKDLSSIEAFAAELDPQIDAILAGLQKTASRNGWIPEAFKQMCKIVLNSSAKKAKVASESETAKQFTQHLNHLCGSWVEQWGYRSAELELPSDGRNMKNWELVKQSLKIHCREMIYQLVAADLSEANKAGTSQTADDQERMHNILNKLNQASILAESVCKQYGAPD